MHISPVCESPLPGTSLWLVKLQAEAPAAAPQPGDYLDAAEQARAARFHFERDRHRYRASHTALRQLLGQHLGQPPAALRFRTGPYDKPQLDLPGAPHFNMSHSGPWALIAIGADLPIGVDIEDPREMGDLMPLAERNFSAAEYRDLAALPEAERLQAFLRCWTRKEACLKAVGSGLSIEPRVFEAGLDSGLCHTEMPVSGQRCALTVQSLELGVGAPAALAWLAPASRALAF
jgi:4'-phosphopantetheinyl transferase